VTEAKVQAALPELENLIKAGLLSNNRWLAAFIFSP
jgi:hypothetical protein